ncbi:hypothetical protein EVAR_61427_1 [Eumeta japonica]|uniref:Uncharacterized protein n=1 Tax=Eumeta variegata TaxID=151549 RepID=A0A4C1Y6Q2_EUMVA|nr:hypothetical protein EVAR_61427_1 [Eumeta japonica]
MPTVRSPQQVLTETRSYGTRQHRLKLGTDETGGRKRSVASDKLSEKYEWTVAVNQFQGGKLLSKGPTRQPSRYAEKTQEQNEARTVLAESLQPSDGKHLLAAPQAFEKSTNSF